MSRSALILLAVSAGCHKTTDGTVDTDVDTEVVDTVVVDTDSGPHPPAEKDFEVDPDVSQAYSAVLTMGESSQSYSFTDKVTYSVTKLQGVWYRHFAGSVEVESIHVHDTVIRDLL